MIAALKQVEAGRKVDDVAREVGVSKQTLYAWKAKYGDMDVTEAQEERCITFLRTDLEYEGPHIRERKPITGAERFLQTPFAK